MDYLGKSAFAYSSMRAQDFETAERLGTKFEAKIRAKLNTAVDSECKAVIGRTLYDISYVDKTRTEMFIYLRGGRAIDDSR